MPRNLSRTPAVDDREESRPTHLHLVRARGTPNRAPRCPKLLRRHRVLWAAILFAALFTTGFLLVMNEIFAGRTQVNAEPQGTYPKLN